jgi:hypothetical protein
MVTQPGRFDREPCYRRRNEGNVIPSERVLRGERAGLWLEWRSAFSVAMKLFPRWRL